MKRFFILFVVVLSLFVLTSCPGMLNKPPEKPSSPIPVNGAESQPENLTLSWNCSDPNGDPLSYDIYFGINTLGIVKSNHTENSYTLNGLNGNTTYKWKIVAKDAKGESTEGDIWTFTTINSTPSIPFNPLPSDNATDVSIDSSLSWSCTDPDGDDLYYDIYFGESNPPPLKSVGISTNNYNPGMLEYSSTYYWKIIAKDGKTQKEGPVWNFTTENAPPAAPYSPDPNDDATNVSVNVTLSWECSDQEGDTITYDIYLGFAGETLLKVESDYPNKSYSPGILLRDKEYNWKIVAKDSEGGIAEGPIWSFTTETTPPETPHNPVPSDDATSQIINPVLSWECSDPDGNTLVYDIYFGTNSNPGLVENDHTTKSYSPGTLEYNITYYWKIVADDKRGGMAEGPIWSFTTMNLLPATPTSPAPSDKQTEISLTPVLSWECSDMDGDSLTYDIYFGTDENPPLVKESHNGRSYLPGALEYSTVYYWKIVAKDEHGGTREGPVWSFLTINRAPSAPINPVPSDGTTNIALPYDFTWECSDPDNDILSYDIYIGQSEPLPLVVDNLATNTYKVTGLQSNTTYYWKVVAKDEHSASATSDIWEFKTKNSPPLLPHNPQPSDGATNVSRTPTLSWECIDPDGDDVTYDIYFGLTASPTLIKSNHETRSLEIGATLANGTFYYWKVVAADSNDFESESPVWCFRTVNNPPTTPVVVQPLDGSKFLYLPVTLKWSSSDPEGDIIYYDLYLGKNTDSLSPIATNITYDSTILNDLDYETSYYWKIVATDSKGDSTSSSIWTFSTLELPPDISFNKTFGGSNWDQAYSIQQTEDGGYIVAGYTSSNDGYVSGNHGSYDAWIVKLNDNGELQWQKCLGGSDDDYAQSIQQTEDGGYIVAGTTESNDGDVSGNHGNYDSWIVKLDETGNIQWQRCLGGSSSDYAQSIQQTNDGGYIVAGYTTSNDGDVSGNHGSCDYWIVKLNSSGNIVWQKCLGGSKSDCAQSIQQTNDGGYIVAGYTTSNNGDVSGNHHYNYKDYWIVKLDGLLNIQWQKCLGGSDDDEAYSIQQTFDGGYIIAGFTESNDGDVSGNHAKYKNDYWVVKLNETGNIQWQKCLGGSENDYAQGIQQTNDGGYIVAGQTSSNDGDVFGNHGGYDYWIVKLDETGNIQWHKCLGGSSGDCAQSIQQTSDGGYIVAGYTSYVSQIRIVKLEAE